MRTSHKHTHTRSRQFWFRLLILTLLLGGLAAGAVRWGLRTTQANELEAARARLEKAQAEFRAHPTKETGSAVQAAIRGYRVALGVVPASPAQNELTPVEFNAASFAVSPKLSDLQVEPRQSSKFGDLRKNPENELPFRQQVPNHPGSVDPVTQDSISPGQNLVTNPLVSFDGLDADGDQTIFGFRVAPPDTVADVGPNHIVETVNSLVRVFDKNGAPLTAQAPLSALFAPLGGPFANLADGNDGDPIVLYDPLADRWLISQFEISDINNAIRAQCFQAIAISQTSDPTGAYFLYLFNAPAGRVNDYPHFGVWPDAYYMTDNGFNTALTAFLGGGCYAFNRTKMLAGDPTANGVFFNIPTSGGMLPTDLDGVVTPPVGTPNLFMEFRADEFGDPADALRIFEFRPNFTTPAASTLTQLADLPVATFDARSPNTRALVEQPTPGESVDAISDRLMHRLAYRTLAGGTQSYVLNFTVNVSGVNPTNAATYQAGVRLTELRRNATSGAVTVNQQVTYAPGSGNGATGRNLWMAAVAQDGEGNIGLAASASSTTLNPTAIYTGRLSGDPANTLPQGEVDALTAVPRGVQLSNTFNRWGDYSSLSVDPSDECTFWAAMEYVDTPNAVFDWNTRIFSFKVNPTCATAPKATISGVATNASAGNTPLAGVSVTTPEGYFRLTTSPTGAYSMSVAPGTYTVTCSKPTFTTMSGTVTVAANGTATFNCALTGTPLPVAGGSTFVTESCSADNRPDPGEVITISLGITNTGGAPTTNLVGTLQATGGVTSPSGPQNYGVVVVGATVFRNFTFRVDPALACGGSVVLTLALQDGATNFGTIAYNFTSGVLNFTNVLAQNFDGVTPPALPSGWTTTNAGSGVAWATAATTPDTTPNAAFTLGQAATGESSLVTPAITIPSANINRLTFRNNFNLESGFDGGVLEIKIGAGAFQDIVAAGGSFTAGGYNGTLANFSGCSANPNPLALRNAWTGNGGGYITSTVMLPAAASGQSVQFRWRAGFDCSVSPTGAAWRVDSILLESGTFVCCNTLPTTFSLVKLGDPLVCTGPGDAARGNIIFLNSTATALAGTITSALPTGLVGVSGSCVASGAGVTTTSCVVSASSVVWNGTVAAGSTLNITYTAQIGDQVQSGATLCATTSGSFSLVGGGPVIASIAPVQACVTINCQPLGPGVLPGALNNPANDQRAGSVLIYNIYTSTAGSSTQNTRIAITNVEPNRTAYVHLFFVDGATCSVADAFICLTPNQTASFLASDLDPGTTGYLVAIASDRSGCPINFNYLIGDEYVKFTSGHQANLAAEAVQAIAGGLTACTPGDVTATLRFNNVSYGLLPRVLAVDNVGSRADGNDPLLIVNSISGDLRAFAEVLRPLFGIIYDDAEQGLSFTFNPGTCQFRSIINNNFPKLTPRFDTFVPAGRSAWFKFWQPSDTTPMLGAIINFNPNATSNSGAYNQGHNLHKLTLSSSGVYTIPILPATCQ